MTVLSQTRADFSLDPKILLWDKVVLLKFETLTHSIISLTISKNHLIVTAIVVT